MESEDLVFTLETIVKKFAVRPHATRSNDAPRLSPAAAQVESEDLVFTLEMIVEKCFARPHATRSNDAPRLSPAAAQVESEDLVFTLETIVEKFGEEMAPYAVGVCQHLTEAFWRACVRPGPPPGPCLSPCSCTARPVAGPMNSKQLVDVLHGDLGFNCTG